MIKNKKLFIVAFLISFITILVYLPSLQNDFVNWDDHKFVYKNHNIWSLDVEFLPWMFTTFHAGEWIPLTWLSYALDYAVWGLNPLGYHLTSIIFHGLNTFIVVILITFLVNIRMKEILSKRTGTDNKGYSTNAIITGCVTGFLFGLHPLHVESVAWISERKDVLYTLFFLLSIIWYLKYTSSPQKQRLPAYSLCILFFFLSLISKPMAVTLPAVLIILDVHPLGRLHVKSSIRSQRSLVIEKLPFFGMSIVSSVMVIFAKQADKAILPLKVYPFGERLLVAFHSIGFYLYKMIWPKDLVPLYPFPSDISIFKPEYAGTIIFFIIVTTFCIYSWKSQKIWFAVWAYYVVTLLPVLGIIQTGPQAAADRYTYMPSLGPFLLVGLSMTFIYRKVSSSNYSFEPVKILLGAFSVFLICYLSFLTFQQIKIWKNSLSLWRTEIAKFPEAFIAYRGIGSAYESMGDHKQALRNFNKALELNPADSRSYLERGKVRELLGGYSGAREDFEKAIEINPVFEQAYYNLGVIYDYYLGNPQRALEHYSTAIQLSPEYALAYNNRGVIYATMKDYHLALKDFNAAIQINNKDSVAFYNRGFVYLMLSSQSDAQRDFQIAARLGYKRAQEFLRSKSIDW
jgi:lipoprotein NlpI